ncbi:uncharacterized protein LOC105387556 [Plutella xylostella]|uniref:uncharacterized protein LOC105387556 n=1 Tax=Plutella xylostella TaxID=51655 RepID=UPI0020326FF9|nr:uncharacterized protein LOC105387556 [Plutella xylostella]
MHYSSLFVIVLVASIIGLCASVKQKKVNLAPDKTARLVQHAIDCVAATGVSPDVLMQFRQGHVGNDEKSQQFVHCLLKRLSLISKDGHGKTQRVLDLYPDSVDKEGIKKAFDECNKLNGSTPTETSFKVFVCFHKTSPVVIGL